MPEDKKDSPEDDSIYCGVDINEEGSSTVLVMATGTMTGELRFESTPLKSTPLKQDGQFYEMYNEALNRSENVLGNFMEEFEDKFEDTSNSVFKKQELESMIEGKFPEELNPDILNTPTRTRLYRPIKTINNINDYWKCPDDESVLDSLLKFKELTERLEKALAEDKTDNPKDYPFLIESKTISNKEELDVLMNNMLNNIKIRTPK